MKIRFVNSFHGYLDVHAERVQVRIGKAMVGVLKWSCPRITWTLLPFLSMLRSLQSYACCGMRGLAVALALLAGGSSLAYADCRPTAQPGAVVLPLAPVQISVPANAPVGTPVGSTHAAIVSDIPFTCSGPDNTRELRVLALADADSGLGNVYATNLPGIGFRIITRGGNFAGIDDGPRNAAYIVKLPPHANRLTGFAVDIQFVTTGKSQGGMLAPGKLASLYLGGNDFVDVMVPENGIAFAAMQCAPVSVNGEMSTGVGTMGSFTQEAAVISTGCGASGVSLAVGVEQGYVYGSHPALSVEAAPKHPARDGGGFGALGALGSASRAGIAGVTVHRNRDSSGNLMFDDGRPDATDAVGSTQGSSGGFAAGGGMAGSMRR
jgi:hypothetical protein